MTAPSPLPAAKPRLLKEMIPSEVAAAQATDPRLIVPVGTCEQHGPHLPMSCDTIIVERLANDLSIEYGVNSTTERVFPGNGSVRKKTLHRMLNDLLDSWESCGFEEFILLTAHGHDPHQEALATVITKRARVRVVDMFAVNLTDLLEGQTEPMHGDEADTSIMLYIAPHLVRMELAEDYMVSRESLRRYRRGWLRVPKGSSGSIGRPSLASAAKGRAIYERIRARVSDRIFRAPPADE
jgi:creatinine amidohydrolase